MYQKIKNFFFIKLAKKFILICIYIFSFFLVIPVKLLSPFILIRFLCIRSDVIGHFIQGSEAHLILKAKERKKIIDLCYFSYKPLPNSQWEKMIRRHFFVNSIFRFCDHINRFMFSDNINSGKTDLSWFQNDRLGLIAQNQTKITFSQKENFNGLDFLKNIGMSKNKKFVCVLARDTSYKIKFQSHIKKDWSYNDWRNVDIDTYREAIEFLLSKGYFVFRMGKSANKELIINDINFLDYANSNIRNDFLDLWLMANCEFAISTGSGIDMISYTHDVPVVYANYDLTQYMPFWSKSICQPKKIYNQKTKKFLTLYEQLDFDYLKYVQNYSLLSKAYKFTDLTSKEILDLVKEMHERIYHIYDNDQENINLQKNFFLNLKKYHNYEKYFDYLNNEAFMGSKFLKQNATWYVN